MTNYEKLAWAILSAAIWGGMALALTIWGGVLFW